MASLLILGLMCLIGQAVGTTIACEDENNDWNPDNQLQTSQNELLIQTIYGVDVFVDRKDGTVSESIKGIGTWEPKNLRTMTRFVKQGDIILNLGAHIGLQAVVLGKIIGPEGRIYIFEPYSLSHNIALKNIALNNLGDRTIIYNLGASDRSTQGYISVDPANTGGSEIFLDEFVANAPSKTELVKVAKVDDIIPQDVIIDFALIDVERMQMEALSGMKKTIERSPDIVIMCEWSGISLNTEDFVEKKRELLEWFVSKKFKFYKIKLDSQNCQPQVFVQTDLKSLLEFQDREFLSDVFIMPDHLNPNAFF